MTTCLITHESFFGHETQPGHPERTDRLKAVADALDGDKFKALKRMEAPEADLEDIALVHPEPFIESIRAAIPEEGQYASIDADTSLSHGSWQAALCAVGAALHGVDQVMAGKASNVFCAVRPPGHHAETARAMGFCIFSNAAIAAHYVRKKHGAERIAVIDFDVHHGNGTQEIFWSDPDLFYGSTHQMPLFPGTGAKTETGMGNIFNAPLRAGDGGAEFKQAMEEVILKELEKFSPDFIIISAGFDAHARDPLGNLQLQGHDFAWITTKLLEIADKKSTSRVISLLEGGYDLEGLAQSVDAHVVALMAH